jgi:flavin-dependent thymidylate synthase
VKVFLAGYNLDSEVIEELKAASPPRLDATPETLSAAYARISRDPRPVNELRRLSRREVEKSRKSNETIIFGLGHSSVAEHVVFNFDVLDISRYALEFLESFRLCSFTEKSQRYIKLNSAYIIPPELKNTRWEKPFEDLLQKQNELYCRLLEKLQPYAESKYPALAADPRHKNLLEGCAKEDARYITALATTAQAGMTVNARNLEKMLRRFAACPLQEVRSLGQALHALVRDIAPSVVKYPAAGAFDKNTSAELAAYIAGLAGKLKPRAARSCVLLDCTRDGDLKILAALVARARGLDFAGAFQLVKKISRAERKNIFKLCIKNMRPWDQLLREFELADLTFELVVSASCFAQLKRHRMATILAGNYAPELGLRVPPSIKAVGMAAEFERVAEESAELYAAIHSEIPAAADYALTNAQQRRVICKINLRELCHISRLREDAHAQWDIREIAGQMSALAKKALPLTTGFLGGKDAYNELYSRIFGQAAET